MDRVQLRAETLRRFDSWGIDANPHLPPIETQDQLRPRTASEVAGRAIAAGHVVALCSGAEPNQVRTCLEASGLWRFVSPRERALFVDGAATQEEKHYHSWLAESVQFLAWSLRLAELNHFRRCDDSLASLFPHQGDPSEFLATARLRPLREILQECDTLYMLHWYCGRSGFGQSLREDFLAHGLPPERFHQELFQLR